MKNPNHQNLSDAFPELNFFKLKRYAGLWAKKFKEAQIKRILLYRYSSKFQASLGGAIPTNFFVVFEVSISHDKFETYTEQLFAGAEPDPAYEAYGELLFATEYYQTGLHDFPLLFYPRFKTTAYEGTAQDNFEYEWQFFPKGPDEKLPLGVLADEPFWSLYKGKEKQHQISARSKAEQVKKKYPQEVIDLLTKAKPEIEDLYKGMKANQQAPDQENGETYEGKLKDAAEYWFEKAGNEYQIITAEHVRSSHLYFPNTTKEIPDVTHPSRDFKGKLCQVLISNTFSNKYISDLNSPPPGFGIKPLNKLLKSFNPHLFSPHSRPTFP